LEKNQIFSVTKQDSDFKYITYRVYEVVFGSGSAIDGRLNPDPRSECKSGSRKSKRSLKGQCHEISMTPLKLDLILIAISAVLKNIKYHGDFNHKIFFC
jgi:hypothetical protein